MKSIFLGLACLAMAALAGTAAYAGRPQTLSCNQTVTFGPLDCNGTASLVCGPNGALLSYNMTGCLYYTYDNGYATPISQVAPLQLNTVYRAKLTRTPEPQGQGTVLTINTAYGSPAPVPVPPAPQPSTPQLYYPYAYPTYSLYLGYSDISLGSCAGYNSGSGIKLIRGAAGSYFAIIHGSTECSVVDVFNSYGQYTGQTIRLQYNSGEVQLNGGGYLKLHSESGEHGSLFQVNL